MPRLICPKCEYTISTRKDVGINSLCPSCNRATLLDAKEKRKLDRRFPREGEWLKPGAVRNILLGIVMFVIGIAAYAGSRALASDTKAWRLSASLIGLAIVGVLGGLIGIAAGLLDRE